MTLSSRITLFSTGLVAVLVLLVNVSVYALFKANLTDGELERVSTQVTSIATALEDARVNPEAQQQYMNAYAPGEGMLRLIDEQGNVLVTITKDQDLLDLPSTFSIGEAAELTPIGEERYATASTPLIWNDGQIVTLELTERLEHLDQTLPLLRVILIAASLIVLVPTFLASQALGRFIRKPIRSLATTMNDIRNQGTLKKVTEVPTNQQDELTDLSHTFNHMIDLLQQNVDQQQQFVSDASHELKTPLTVIESYARMLERWGKNDPTMIDEAVDAILSESGRMKGLTEQMLLLANGETPAHEKQVLQLERLVLEAAEQMSVATNRPIEVNGAKQSFYVNGSIHLLKQLFFILLDNGIKYSEDPLVFKLAPHGTDYCTVAIEDKGIGIKDAEHTAVFERFYRVDKARTRETGGSGLGLSIASKIVAEHHGTLTLKSSEGQGSTFTVTLPIAEKESAYEAN